MTGRATTGGVATGQIVGAREQQEDTLVALAPVSDSGPRAGEVLLVLADGMGGHVGGEVASRLVVKHFCAAYRNSSEGVPEALRSSLDRANEALAGTVAEEPRLGGMGTTLVGCVVKENSLNWISVGDSPLWLYHGGDLQRLNADHSMVPLLEDMVSSGELTREEMLTDPRRSLLRSVVTGNEIDLVDLSDEPLVMQPGEIVVLASDGVETLAEKEMAAMLQDVDAASLDELAGKLLAGIEAAAKPFQDNASIVLYCCRQAGSGCS